MLPIFQTDNKDLLLLQTRWASEINPVLVKPQNLSIILKNVALTTGSNTVNHRLGRKLQGWKLVRQRAAASIYDNQDNNQQSDLTLILISNANVVCDIEVF